MSNISVQQMAGRMPYHVFGRLTCSGVVTAMPVELVYPDSTASVIIPIKTIASVVSPTKSDGSVWQRSSLGIDRSINPWLLVVAKGTAQLDLVQEQFLPALDTIYGGDQKYAILARVLYTGIVDYQSK